MARINSVTTRLRLKLVKKLDPRPPRGEMWCMGCALVGGENLAVDYSQMQAHLENHRRLGDKGHYMSVRATGPVTSLKKG